MCHCGASDSDAGSEDLEDDTPLLPVPARPKFRQPAAGWKVSPQIFWSLTGQDNKRSLECGKPLSDNFELTQATIASATNCKACFAVSKNADARVPVTV